MVYEYSIFHAPWTGSPFLFLSFCPFWSDRPQSLNSLEIFSLILEFSSATLGSWDRDCSSLLHMPFEIIASIHFLHHFLVTSSFSSFLTYLLSLFLGTLTRCIFNPFVFNVFSTSRVHFPVLSCFVWMCLCGQFFLACSLECSIYSQECETFHWPHQLASV